MKKIPNIFLKTISPGLVSIEQSINDSNHSPLSQISPNIQNNELTQNITINDSQNSQNEKDPSK
jgi:hypothetical protein